MTIPEQIRKRIAAGQAALDSRRTESYRMRAERFEALRKVVAADLPADIYPFADVGGEQPELFPQYHVCIRIGDLAEIRARYYYAEHKPGWIRTGYGNHGRVDWAVLPLPGAPAKSWRIEAEVDVALAAAAEMGPLFHAQRVIAEQPTEISRGSKTARFLGIFRRQKAG